MSKPSVADYIAAVRKHGQLIAEVAARSDLSTAVPTCPGWTLADLLRHLGYVHRWAAGYVANGTTEMTPALSEEEQLRGGPDAATLVTWYSDCLQTAVCALSEADPSVECWTFLDAPTPLTFWARRQAHETSIHRADAELATTGQVTPVDTDFAMDGIDEVLSGFAMRQLKRLRADPPRSLAIVPTDAIPRWRISMTPERTTITAEDGDADCTVTAPASDLYLLLWNRRSRDGLDLSGDGTLLDRWREAIRVRWK